jgi:hypothetical protein
MTNKCRLCGKPIEKVGVYTNSHQPNVHKACYALMIDKIKKDREIKGR